MPDEPSPPRFRFGVFEADAATGELRRKGIRIKLHAQPFQVLMLLLERPGQMLTREKIARTLWPEGTFVDYEHGVNSALNRLRDALGDQAANPRFIETLARRGYRFVAPVERLDQVALADATPNLIEPPLPISVEAAPPSGLLERFLATPADLPRTPHRVVKTLFLLLQCMYLGFYIGALANLPEIVDLFSPLPFAARVFYLMLISAALLIPVRIFLFCAVAFHAPHLQARFLRLWPWLFFADILWSLAPFLLLHHIHYGAAIACSVPLVYSPFAQRSLILMGAAGEPHPPANEPRE